MAEVKKIGLRAVLQKLIDIYKCLGGTYSLIERQKKYQLQENNQKLLQENERLRNEYYLISKNSNEKVCKITDYPLTYNQDGLATWHISDFMQDKLFLEAYNLGKKTGSWTFLDLHWRAYVVCWAAIKGMALEGDFVECGVNRGGFARTVVHYVNFKNAPKKFYLLDTFKGMPKHLVTKEEIKLGINPHNPNHVKCYEDVKETFKDFENVVIIKGTIPDTLPLVKAEKVAFLSMDMNNAAPEIAAAEFFWDKMVSGAVMVLDDYAYSKRYSVQKTEFNKYAERKGIQILTIPTGQGLIFKP